LSYENAHYREQNKKMPKLGAEVITPQGVGRVRHIHPLKETVTVMLQSSVLTEFSVADLISSKSASGAGCSTCGGCTVKRRASAEEDNARMRRAAPAGLDSPAKEESDTEENGAGKRRRSRRRRKPSARKGSEE